MNITNIIANDGSRQFLSVPETVSWKKLRKMIEKLDGAVETNYISDEFCEMWIDFTYKQHKFTVNNQLGEYWFFVEDINCPDSVLSELASYFIGVLEGK
jgi:hypothetical protein